MKTLMSATAIAALLAVTPVMAQETTPAPTAPAEQQLNPPLQQAPSDPAVTPAPSDTMTPDPAMPADSAATTTTPSDGPMFIERQEAGEVLVSDLVGETIYNSQEENIGTVSDVITTENGQIRALVVEVGGFLGIGAKDVAVNYDRFMVVTSAESENRVVLDTPRESLESAPDFMTLAEIAAQQPAQPSTGTDTMTAPSATQ
ncbi:PRC-barrel domain-containing protein [Methylobrevis albus]|uniref:PRC-barrel domain-containing protein n=1 Tax=Methylobrevis albus TaxID=2793297 RepID=A0A931HZU3_9HYPH|nr:PRC-barrel domain-containing protein [Methylobrevis albus]MBH0236703.1 PRC-barrel domain-containing protein [Methylobrevis albus]